MTQQARFRSECMECIKQLKASVGKMRELENDLSMATLFENIRFFIYCRNGDIPKAKLSYDKMMAHYQDMLDEIMYGENHPDDKMVANDAYDDSVFTVIEGQDAQAVHMGKVMMTEKETLAGWLQGAIKYGHK